MLHLSPLHIVKSHLSNTFSPTPLHMYSEGKEDIKKLRRKLYSSCFLAKMLAKVK